MSEEKSAGGEELEIENAAAVIADLVKSACKIVIIVIGLYGIKEIVTKSLFSQVQFLPNKNEIIEDKKSLQSEATKQSFYHAPNRLERH